jgi:hypothetical protein
MQALGYAELKIGCLTAPIRLACDAFQLEDHGLDSIRAAGNKSILVIHPGAEFRPQHHRHDDLFQIIPGPATVEFGGTFVQFFHDKRIPRGEFVTRTMMQSGPAVFLR